MQEKISGAVNKLESIVKPAAALFAAIDYPLGRYKIGGAKDVVASYKFRIPSWHPPNFDGAMNFIERRVIPDSLIMLTGHAINMAGSIIGVSEIGRAGRAVKNAGSGAILGHLFDFLVHSWRYNPNGGAATFGSSGSILSQGPGGAGTHLSITGADSGPKMAGT